MKKYLIAMIIILAAVLCFGCADSDSGKTTTTKEKGIRYVSNGEVVTDDSVLGDNVFVFDEKDEIADVQKKVDEIYQKQETNQFGDERYAVLFKPGTYDKSL